MAGFHFVLKIFRLSAQFMPVFFFQAIDWNHSHDLKSSALSRFVKNALKMPGTKKKCPFLPSRKTHTYIAECTCVALKNTRRYNVHCYIQRSNDCARLQSDFCSRLSEARYRTTTTRLAFNGWLFDVAASKECIRSLKRSSSTSFILLLSQKRTLKTKGGNFIILFASIDNQ